MIIIKPLVHLGNSGFSVMKSIIFIHNKIILLDSYCFKHYCCIWNCYRNVSTYELNFPKPDSIQAIPLLPTKSKVGNE